MMASSAYAPLPASRATKGLISTVCTGISMRRCEVGDPDNGTRECINIGPLPPAEPIQQRVAPQATYHLHCVVIPNRSEPPSYVAQQLDGNAAKAEHHHWPEDRISLHTQDALDAIDHGRDEQPVDPGGGDCRPDPIEHRGGRVAHRRNRNVERNAADLRLVHNVRRDDFER